MNYPIENNKLSLNLILVDGDIQVIGEDRLDIEVELGDLRKNTADEVFDISYENGELSIIQKDSKKLLKMFNIKAVDVQIKLPNKTAVAGDIKNVSGDININELVGYEGSIATRNGDVEINKIASVDLKISIVNGDLSVKEIDGKLKVNNVNGDVQLRENNYKAININNVNGDIVIDGDYELEEDAKIKIVSGDIKLNCKEYKNDKKIVISSVTGDNVVSDKFPEGVIIQHGGLKELKNLKFLKDSFQPMIKQFKEHFKHMPFDKIKEEVNPKKNDEENIQLILNMLSEGKITAEDAEKLISALKK
ncbi:MAG: DUF4097 family beta strand repeat-containing protein [Candidatus Delongbacteria bacterium]|jgi:hypothetical protein|nr:DUF4097 family beta strand repeat-containing protein [Candidatus Delongbacteria bacterium]